MALPDLDPDREVCPAAGKEYLAKECNMQIFYNSYNSDGLVGRCRHIEIEILLKFEMQKNKMCSCIYIHIYE